MDEMIRVDIKECEVIEKDTEIFYKYQNKIYVPYGCTPCGIVSLVELNDWDIKLSIAYDDFNKSIQKVK